MTYVMLCFRIRLYASSRDQKITQAEFPKFEKQTEFLERVVQVVGTLFVISCPAAFIVEFFVYPVAPTFVQDNFVD